MESQKLKNCKKMQVVIPKLQLKGSNAYILKQTNEFKAMKVTKDLISLPSNFQHIAHMGPSGKIVEKLVEAQQNQSEVLNNSSIISQPMPMSMLDSKKPKNMVTVTHHTFC